MLNTYDLFATRISHGKLPIQIDLHKKIKFFVDNNYLEEDKVSCVNGFQFHEDFDGKKELNEHLNIYLNSAFKIKISNGLFLMFPETF